jgi:hypothetical protein
VDEHVRRSWSTLEVPGLMAACLYLGVLLCVWPTWLLDWPTWRLDSFFLLQFHFYNFDFFWLLWHVSASISLFHGSILFDYSPCIIYKPKIFEKKLETIK